MTNGWQKALLDRDEQWEKKLAASHKILTDEIRNVAITLGKEISDLASELKKAGEPKSYSVYQIGLTVLVLLAGLVFWPIQLTFGSLKDTNTAQDTANVAQDARIENLVNLIGTEVKARSELMTKEAEARNTALLREADARNAAFNTLADQVTSNYINRREFEAISARGKEERERTTKQFEMLQANVFPKDVHVERWNGFAAQLAALTARLDTGDATLQREIDALQKLLGDQFTARDALLENKERITEMEKLIRDIISRRVTMP